MDIKVFKRCIRKIYEDIPKEPEVKNLADVNKNELKQVMI